MLHGRILAESLRVGCDIQVPQLRLVRIAREDVSGSTSTIQPDVWTLLDVQAPDELARGGMPTSESVRIMSWSFPGGSSAMPSVIWPAEMPP
jgi:hypothetical protein